MPYNTTLLNGGLSLNDPPVLSNPGTLQDCRNFEVAYTVGYKRSDGYERFDGGPSPSDQVPAGATASAFFAARDAAYLAMRSTVQPVPGTGPVCGVFWLRDELYAARDVVTVDITPTGTPFAVGDTLYVVGDTFFGKVLTILAGDGTTQIVFVDTFGVLNVADALRDAVNDSVGDVVSIAASPGAALYKAVGTRGTYGSGSWEYQDLGYVLNYTNGEIAFPNRTPGTVVPAEIQSTVWKVADLTVDIGSFWGGITNGTIPTVLQTDDGDTSFAFKAQSTVLSGVVDRSARISTFGFDDTDVPTGSLITGLTIEIVRRAYYSDPLAATEYWTDYDLRLSYPDVTPTPGAPGPNFADTLTQYPQSGTDPDSGVYTTATYGGLQNNLGYGTLTPERLKDADFTFWFNSIYSLPAGSTPDGSQARITLVRMMAHYSPPSPSLYVWNGTSAVFIDIVRAYQQSGDIAMSDAAGVLYITANGVTRPITSGEEIRTLPQPGVTPDGGAADGSSLVALTASAMTPNLMDGSAALAANNSKYQSITTNFTAASEFEAIYGVSGAGPAFTYDGTAFARILTGAPSALEKPRHVVRHKDRLFLGYLSGDVTYSAPSEPLNYSATDTAGTKNFGAPITGFAVMNGETLGVFTRDDVQMIQGPILTFASAVISPNVGCIEYSVVTTGNYVYTSNRGIQGIGQTPAYGDFDSSTLSGAVWPWLADRVQQPVNFPTKQQPRNLINSVAARAKHQYRTYYKDGMVLTATFLVPGEVPQYTFQYMPNPWEALLSAVESQGRDRIFGSYGTNGYVYEIDKGNRYDADAIQGYIILTTDDLKVPYQNKWFSDMHVHGQTYGWATAAMSRNSNYAAPTPAINYPLPFGEPTSTNFSDLLPFVSFIPARQEGRSLSIRIDVDTGSQSPVVYQVISLKTELQENKQT